MSEPTVSVILASNGRSATIDAQLASLAAQENAPRFEVVLVANQASERLAPVVERWQDRLELRVVPADAKVGLAYARNAGVAAAKGCKLLFVDDDDVVGPGYVAAMSAALERNPVVGAKIDLAMLNPGWRADVREVAQVDEPRPFLFAYGATLGVRADVFTEVGPFDERLENLAGEDAEWGMRLRQAGYNFAFVPDAVLHYRFRTKYRELARQGYRYGRGGERIEPEWSGWGAWLSSLLGPLRLVVMGPGRGMRHRGVFLIGRRVGRAFEHCRR